jgi:alpha-tubulin suppressor-like RCC1 family protein
MGPSSKTLGLPHHVLAFEGMRIASVAVGGGFTLAVTEDGAVYSFGRGDGYSVMVSDGE